MFISKVNIIKSNTSDAIRLYTDGRYLGAFTLAAAALSCLREYAREQQKSMLEAICAPDKELRPILTEIVNTWDQIRHADQSKDDIFAPTEELARLTIASSIIDLIQLLKEIPWDHEIFLSWTSGCHVAPSQQFKEKGEHFFPDIKSKDFPTQIQRLVDALVHFSPKS